MGRLPALAGDARRGFRAGSDGVAPMRTRACRGSRGNATGRGREGEARDEGGFDGHRRGFAHARSAPAAGRPMCRAPAHGQSPMM
nr:deoxyribodipyrimidine photolyase [Burkholderia pseudomallei]